MAPLWLGTERLYLKHCNCSTVDNRGTLRQQTDMKYLLAFLLYTHSFFLFLSFLLHKLKNHTFFLQALVERGRKTAWAILLMTWPRLQPPRHHRNSPKSTIFVNRSFGNAWKSGDEYWKAFPITSHFFLPSFSPSKGAQQRHSQRQNIPSTSVWGINSGSS